MFLKDTASLATSRCGAVERESAGLDSVRARHDQDHGTDAAAGHLRRRRAAVRRVTVCDKPFG